MKVGVIIPSRGDRPGFMDNLIRMINAQTFQPTLVYVADDPPESNECDITKRYRTGYNWFREMKMDVLVFMEDDDWYAPDYIKVMVAEWIKAGQPQLFGTSYTIYYHLRLFAYFKMTHFQRSSAMSTLIKPDMNVNWPADSERYCDSHLWFKADLQQKIFTPEKIICLGMKHAVGKCGGQNHNDRLDRYINNDQDKKFLSDHLDPDSFKFYSEYFARQA